MNIYSHYIYLGRIVHLRDVGEGENALIIKCPTLPRLVSIPVVYGPLKLLGNSGNYLSLISSPIGFPWVRGGNEKVIICPK